MLGRKLDWSISAIIPATGWVALFDGDGKEGEEDVPDVRPVACWALMTEDGGQQKIVPMVSREGRIVEAEAISGYHDVVLDVDVLDDLLDENVEDGDPG